MRRVLVPVDGSASSDRAVQSLIQKYRANPKEVEFTSSTFSIRCRGT